MTRVSCIVYIINDIILVKTYSLMHKKIGSACLSYNISTYRVCIENAVKKFPERYFNHYVLSDAYTDAKDL